MHWSRPAPPSPSTRSAAANSRQILTAWSAPPTRPPQEYSRYGRACTNSHIYGGLDTRSDRIEPAFEGCGASAAAVDAVPAEDRPSDIGRLRQRVASELKTTFASHYTQVVSLQETLQLSNIAVYNKPPPARNSINPNKG